MIVAGFGFRESASLESLLNALAQANRSGAPIGLIATVTDKAGTSVFQKLARQLDIPLQGIEGDSLSLLPTITHSTASQACRNTGSVAEATALAAAGPHAHLLGPRAISSDRLATCALAEGKDP
ncbi:cobalamin biosynthesis protein [Paracoccus sp. 11-3]|uniref:Cobalamin biosynthesis protein n=1 Tax=Paracoccus amoyensis TaxID=2760093 RepID=A0A926JAE3_9RHOB|nr:cobalamin biosynthesis protein [Paracoccus amoyensis]